MPQRTVATVIQQRKVVTALPGTTVDQAARLMKKEHISAVMVVEHEKLVGIFTERDAVLRVLAENRSPRTTRVGTVMTRHPKTVGPEQSFAYALFLMHEGGFRHVPVVVDGRPVGIVSASDALAPEMLALGEQLNEHQRIGEILG